MLGRVKEMGQGTGNETSLFSLQSEFSGASLANTVIYKYLLIGGEENIFYMLIFINVMQIVRDM